MFNWHYGCRVLDYNVLENYNIIPYLTLSQIKAAYLFDKSSQVFSNLLSPSKQPVATLGADETSASDDPTLVGSNHYEIGNGQSIKVGEVFYNDFAYQSHRAISHIIRIKFLSLPDYQHFEPIYTFIYEKEVIVKVSSTGDFWVGNQNSFFTTSGVQVTTGQWYMIKITFTRAINTIREHDCSVGIEIDGVGEVGGDLECNKIFNIL